MAVPAIEFLRSKGLVSPDKTEMIISQGNKTWSLTELLEEYRNLNPVYESSMQVFNPMKLTPNPFSPGDKNSY